MSNKTPAFGLIETLVACGILIMVFGATSSLGILSTHGTIIAKHKTEAYHIAQDAMERIKGARDWVWENWDESNAVGKGVVTWTTFWNEADGDFTLSSNVPDEFSEIKPSLETNCIFINHNDGSLTEATCTSYQPSSTKFKRTIISEQVSINNNVPASNAYKVTVSVSWSDYGQPQSVSLVSYLTNWNPRY